MICKKNKCFEISIAKTNKKFKQHNILTEQSKSDIAELVQSTQTHDVELNDTNSAIPKNIFLIWFGNKIPVYVDMVVNKYKERNPSFNVVFIHKTLNEIVYSVDPLINRCKQYILDALHDKDTSIYSNHIRWLYAQQLNFIQILADIYRFELIWENGGIYVDCDTWPLKSFDDTFLEPNGFSCCILAFTSKNANGKWSLKSHQQNDFDIKYITEYSDTTFSYFFNDKYFFGLPKHFTNQVSFKDGYSSFYNKVRLATIKNLEQTPNFLKIRDEFIRGNEIGPLLNKYHMFSQHNSLPIMHFRDNTWNTDVNENKMYCMYDDIIYNNADYSIPKRIFMIWIGDTLPCYLNKVINRYRQLNPKFTVTLYHYTTHDLENPTDKYLTLAIKHICDTIDGKPNDFYDFILRYINENRYFSQIVANLLRFIILNEDGGIYVDCDTWPLRPFDDALMDLKSFCPQIIGYLNKLSCKQDSLNNNIKMFEDKKYFDLNYKNNSESYSKITHNDIFFIGQPKDCINRKTIAFSTYPLIQNNAVSYTTYIRNDENDENFKKMRQKFLNNEFDINETIDDADHYIYHFADRTWLPNSNNIVRSTKSKYDALLNDFKHKDDPIESKIHIAVERYFSKK